MHAVTWPGRVVVALGITVVAVALVVSPTTAGGGGSTNEAQLLFWVLSLKFAHEPLRMDVNSATLAELSDVPGIHRRQALRIIAQRPYANLQDLWRAGLSPGAIDRAAAFLAVGVDAPSALPATPEPIRPR
jgi:hypothetical protein